MYERIYGSNYNRDLSTTEIAKLIRTEIRARIKSGALPAGKYSVRSRYFSGGSSIDISVKNVDMLIWNPERLIREEFKSKDKPWEWRTDEPVYTPWAQDLIAALKGIMWSYNHDGSESMVDYFDVNFYGHPEFDYEWAGEQRKRAIEALRRTI